MDTTPAAVIVRGLTGTFFRLISTYVLEYLDVYSNVKLIALTHTNSHTRSYTNI